VLDENGKIEPLELLNNDDIYLCFDLPELHLALIELGLNIPNQLIDLKTETCLLNNIIRKKDSDKSIFHLPLNEIIKREKLDLFTPDGTIWLHPAFENSRKHLKRESINISTRHAKWQMLLWRKLKNKINLSEAKHRAEYNLLASKISCRGIGINLTALKSVPKEYENYKAAIQDITVNGRCQSKIKPLNMSTGRNAPSTYSYPLSVNSKLRNLIIPSRGNCLIHLDYKSQEVCIAAVLSQDQKLLELCQNGKPYQWFANTVTPFIPVKLAKKAFIAFLYGATISKSIIKKISLPPTVLEQLYTIHREQFRQYWSWTDSILEDAYKTGQLSVSDGWKAKVISASPPRSLINWPIQATGSLLLSKLVRHLHNENLLPVGLNHDAVLLDVPSGDVKKAAYSASKIMKEVSEQHLGFRLNVSIDIGQPNQSLLDILEK
jgi:hypothetical protein